MGSQGQELNPREEGWGLLGHSINEDGMIAMTQRKWRFLGMFHAHMSLQLGLWQGGELGDEKGVWRETGQDAT